MPRTSNRIIGGNLGTAEAVIVFACSDVPGFEIEVVLARDSALGVRSIGLMPDHPLVGKRGSRYKPPPARPLTRRALQAVPLGELERLARAHLAEVVDANDQGVMRLADEHPAIMATIRSSAGFKRQGRRGRGDVFYAEAAAVYRDEVQADPSRATVRAAARLGLDASQLRGVLGQARRRGLLTSAPAGRAGGSPTEKARRLLADARQVTPGL